MNSAQANHCPLSERNHGSLLLPLAIFLLLALATIAAWQWQSRIQIQAEEQASNQESAAITAEIRDRLNLHGQFLRSLQAFAVASPTQDLAAWRRFAGAMEIKGGLAGMFAFAYAPAMQLGNTGEFRNSAKFRVDRRNIRIFPGTDTDLALPVHFVAPETPALMAIVGFDQLSERARRDAISRAILTGTVAMTGPIELQPDKGTRRPGFQMVHAILPDGPLTVHAGGKKPNFSGVVLTAYRFDEFMASFKLPLSSRFVLQIFDEPLAAESIVASPPTLIYNSNPGFRSSDAPMLHHEIDFGGRNWILHFYPNIQDSPGLDTPALLLYAGLFGSLLLAVLVRHQSTHRERAERYALNLTGELSAHRCTRSSASWTSGADAPTRAATLSSVSISSALTKADNDCCP